ncbi:MAG: hypothetical protein HYX69_14350 [Planctomycetia bacterium]|nr:hypothetical protein [Planctomycetia bacterium]
MLFQTYYRLDPWGFTPPLEPFASIRFDLAQERFSLFMTYQHRISEDEGSQILIQTLHRCDAVSEDAQRLFAGEMEIDWLTQKGKQDGLNPFPRSCREFILGLHARMDQLATGVFNVLRWRLGILGGPLTLSSEWPSMRWHDPSKGEQIMDEHGYLNRQMLAGVFTLDLPEMQRVSFDETCRHSVENLLQFQSREPLHHDLFREAWQNKEANWRSLLVMAVAAAETGFKTTAIDLSPAVAWLLEKLPSPSLPLMVREYLEQLPARRTFDGQVRRPPKMLITTLQKGVELRNKLVHGRVEDVDSDELSDILVAIRDLLYLLDFYRGHEWALARITPDVLAKIKEPPPCERD